ncbi:pwwp domain [Holotrichia oblita]|uniref:Pwwp domain n=1 Tax=Holotrichia oblita TaxID=644536 RepID=A0ACB9TLQ7_HOLOL|nr:pwwp domain [Holotrichia oblita]
MMKKAKSFNVGDKVFAKVKGYPAWPAKVMLTPLRNCLLDLYCVYELRLCFSGSIKAEDLFYYVKHKDQFYRNLKRKDYQEAVEQIEAEIKDIGTDGNDEDMETEASTVGDTVDKKGKKRKRESLGEEAQTNKIQKTPSEEFNESQVTDQEEKTEEKTLTEGETVTRSGRIVKIKKFSDDEDEDNKKITKGKKLADQSSSHSETTDETTVESLKVEEVAQDTDTEEEGANENHAVTTKSKTDETVSPTKDIVEESSPLPQKEEFVDVNIVSIGYLETVIAYAEHVKSKSSFYKKRETEPRESLENEVVIAKLPNKLIGIKYNRTTPICDNEYEQAIEEAQEAKRVLAIKDKLENGSITVESEKNNVIINIKTDEDNLQQKHETQVLERKKTKLKYLKIEANLVDYDCKIKSCLGLDKADPKKAYEYMDLMMELDINSLMLKKHPLIVDVMKRLRRYIGNVKEWNLAGDSLETFEADAEKIRQKAEEVFMKFVSLFNVTDASAFWDVFNGEVDKFEEETKDLSESEMFSLCAEPNSRQAFFDSFEDKKEAEKIDKEKNIVEDIETVCST